MRFFGAQPVREAGRIIAFVQNDRYFELGSRPCDGHGNETTLCKYEVGLQFPQDLFGLAVSFENFENIADVFRACVAPHFARFDDMVGDAVHKLALDPVRRADIMHLDPFFLEPGDKGKVRGDVARASAPRQNDLFIHRITSYYLIYNLTHHSITNRRPQARLWVLRGK